ncbi:MAG: signal peptide peptidase SppA [Candidatus Aenigmarchaeota archaeon]|nr:signal peptide peptidase SppA [Candidatus Aenigmarchaeota archaeon]MCK5322379.1 signal peptide peptidase SppA [Candidatus Aenigmarchaeota archaeon]
MTKRKKRKWFLSILVIISIIYILVKIASFTTEIINPIPQKDNFALIPITGLITYNGAESLFTDTPSIKETINYIETANKSKDIKGIILLIDSPGGTVLASKDLAKAIEQIEKPNVVLIRQMGASGAYWAASASDYIIADEVSMIGSIGVIGSYLNFNNLLEDYNVSYERLIAGQYKDMGSPFKELTDEERAKFQGTIDDIYDIFIRDIAEKRGLSIEDTRGLATGEIYLGKEAMEKGLIDKIGDKTTAIEYLKEQTNTTDYLIVEYREDKTMLERLLSAERFYWIGVGMGESLKNIKTENTVRDIGLY